MKRMVRPAQVEIEVQHARRRTSHGIVCQKCGSSDVEVEKTETRQLRVYPEWLQGRQQLKKRRCRCNGCGWVWSSRVKVTEERLGE